MNINVNQECTITLRKRGVECLEKHYEELGLELPKKYSVGDEYKAPLWDIMNIFGDYIYMGPPPPFDTTIWLKAL